MALAGDDGRRTRGGAAAQEVPAAEGSDASVRCYGTNGWQSRWLWQRPSITRPARAQHAAPRGQETGTRAGEVEEQVSHSGLRAPKTPPPGARPGCLSDPEPQRSDRSQRRFVGNALPTLALPSLAGSAAEAVDASTLTFLLGQNHVLKMKDEEEKRREEEEEAKLAKEEEEAEDDAAPGHCVQGA